MTPFAALVLLLAQPALDAKSPDPSAKLFDPREPLPTIRVEVDKDNLAKLKGEPRSNVHATLWIDDEKFEDVGLHLKGAAGSARSWDDKPALTINSNLYRRNRLVRGLDKFHLNNSVQDELYLNEIIVGDLFRRCGVPSARGSHAFVELNGRRVGLYVLKEGYDETFLKRYFKNTKGNLYDGGFLQDIEAKLKLDSGDGCEWKDLKALAAAARRDPKERLDALGQKLDLDKFFALWVVEVLCVDWDGYTRNFNNYRLYHDPATDKFVFFAHGKDQEFQNPHDALVHGWRGLLARKLWETEEGRRRYIETMKHVLEAQFQTEEIFARIDPWAARLHEYFNEARDGAGDQYQRAVRDYKSRIKARIEYIKREAPKLKP